jgi:hypothetical protein
MTLLPGVAVAHVVAFLTTFVALNIGLVVCPFVRIWSCWSFLRTFVVGTWLALRGVKLHLLQPVVVVLLGWNIPLDFRVRLTLEVSTLLLHLHFEDAGVDLDRQIGHLLQGRGAFVPHCDFFPDLVL